MELLWRVGDFLIENAEPISALLGVISAVLLAAPLIRFELPHRRDWENFSKLRRGLGSNPQQKEEIERLRDMIIDARLGEYRAYLNYTLAGFVFLLFSFVFLFVHWLGVSNR